MVKVKVEYFIQTYGFSLLQFIVSLHKRFYEIVIYTSKNLSVGYQFITLFIFYFLRKSMDYHFLHILDEGNQVVDSLISWKNSSSQSLGILNFALLQHHLENI